MLSNLMYVVQVWAGHDLVVLALTIGVENLTDGMGSAAFVAYLSGLCSVDFTATQYALLTSLAAAGRTILSAWGGKLASLLGWTPFFVLSTVLCFPRSCCCCGSCVGRRSDCALRPEARVSRRKTAGCGAASARPAAPRCRATGCSTSRQKRGPWFISARCATSCATT